MKTPAQTTDAVVASDIKALLEIPHRTLLAVGSANWDFYSDICGNSRGVRAVPKSGEQYRGCKECSFGSVLYWANAVQRNPGEYVLTEAGKAFVAADYQALRAIDAAW